MFCPKCKAEYRSGFTECSDCGVGLVDRVPDIDDIAPRPDPVVEDLAVLDTLDQFDAGQLCSFLEGQGIPARMHGPSVVNPYDVGGVSGIVQVLVPIGLLGEARELRSKAQLGELSIDDGRGE